MVGREVTVELKNDLAIRGTLHSMDHYLNIKLKNTRVVDQENYPHMVDCHVKIFPRVSRGWTVRYNDEDEVAVKCAEEAHENILGWFTKCV